MLEALANEDNAFITLTYADEHLPAGSNLRPDDIQLFWKRLRDRFGKFRYFAVGEYGDLTHRPHYHAALFGYPACADLRSYSRPSFKCMCFSCSTIRDTWGLGDTKCLRLEPASAAYIAAYTTKKLTSKDDPRLNGRHPEFSRMSRRPGIGSHIVDDIASELLKHGLDETQADVPEALRHGNKMMPLGRFLRSKIRERIGHEKTPSQAGTDVKKAQLQTLLS